MYSSDILVVWWNHYWWLYCIFTVDSVTLKDFTNRSIFWWGHRPECGVFFSDSRCITVQRHTLPHSNIIAFFVKGRSCLTTHLSKVLEAWIGAASVWYRPKLYTGCVTPDKDLVTRRNTTFYLLIVYSLSSEEKTTLKYTKSNSNSQTPSNIHQ